MKKIRKYIAPYLTALLISLHGIVLDLTIGKRTAIVAVLVIASLLPIFLLVANILLTKRYVKRINQAKVADMNRYLLRHREEAEETTVKGLKKLQRIRKTTALYAIFVWLCGGGIAVLGGMLYSVATALHLLFLFYAGTVFCAVYDRFHVEKRIEPDKNWIQLAPNDYPTLYSLARRAADELGCREDIMILLSTDCNARILKDKGRYLLELGIVLLHIISDDELYCILLHEFSHVSQKHRASMREARYFTSFSNRAETHTGMDSFLAQLFLFFDIRYSFRYSVYRYATSVVHESDADRDMARLGTPETAASALLKLQYDNLYFWENGVRDEPSIFASETLSANYLTDKIATFRDAVESRHEDWNALVDREILANNATHPTLKMRLDILGIQEVKTLEYDGSDAYRAELQKALDKAEALIYDDRKKSYAKDRKEAYLDPLSRIEAWHEQGEPISAENYADLITDLKQLGRHTEAEALCERAIGELPENSSMHAYYIKGCALLCRYDPKGLDYVYHAIEKNQNYLEEGLQMIGTFCCLTGREQELLEYREKAARLAQKNKDEDSQANFLSRYDKLTREQLPDGMLEDILTYIHSVDCGIIENIYLVRKTVSESFFTSAFIIHFFGGTDAQRDEIMHKIFRYLDSYPVEWQFSLFDYFEYPEVKVERIEGSLVYSKSNKTYKERKNGKL